MREKYESLPLVQLKELAKVRGLKGTSTMKKAELSEAKNRKSRRDRNVLSDRRGITDRIAIIVGRVRRT